MNKHTGKERHRLKQKIRTLEYQQEKWGICEIRQGIINDIKRELKLKNI